MKPIFLLFTAMLFFPLLGISQTTTDFLKTTIAGLDEVAPFHEGLAAVRKGDQWGFIDESGQLVIDFRSDLVWNRNPDTNASDVTGVGFPEFKEGLCLVKEIKEEDIPYYGFIDTSGALAIEPEYINISPFEKGYALGIYVKKTMRGQNEFKLNIFDYSFTEVVLNSKGEIMMPLAERSNIQMSKKRYQLPTIHSKMLGTNLLAMKTADNRWQINRLNFQLDKP
ncbi:MAG: WG repeat-containing protein [Flavobacteriaceae bacterium]